MAIEDEIINITDIDIGTEILNNDKLIIETNNGTKLLAFKDLVIGEDNITFKDKLVQGDGATGGSATKTAVVAGHKILTSDTTAGHSIKYADISGTVELSKSNYNAITQYASLSDTFLTEDKIKSLRTNIAAIGNAAPALAAVLTLSATNFKVKTGSKTKVNGSGSGNKNIFYTQLEVDPVKTNPDVVFTIGDATTPFKITYPPASDGSFSPCYIYFSGNGGDLGINLNNTVFHVRVYKNDVEIQFDNTFTSKNTPNNTSLFSFIEYITNDDVITITTDARTSSPGGFFQGIKLAT